MELSGSKIKKFIIFPEMEPCTGQSKLKNFKKDAVEAVKPFRTAKAVTKGNHRLSKFETTSTVSMKLSSRINLGRQDARAPISRL